MAKYIGIDLGTSSVLIYVRGKGIIFEEPSVVALDKKTNEVIAVGKDAQVMLGRTPNNIRVVKPLSEGVISKYEVTLQMLRSFLRCAIGKTQIFKPYIAVCVPGGITNVEERAVRDAVTQIGSKRTYLIEEPIAAAIGAGLDITKSDSKMIVDIGGGTTDIAVISCGKSNLTESIRVGSDKFDEAIIRYMRNKHRLIIGQPTAEQIKIEIGTVWQRETPVTFRACGRDLMTGLPNSVEVASSEMVGALEEPVTAIVEAVCSVIEKIPPKTLSDILNNGIVMTGGGSMLYGLDKLITNVTGIKTKVAENAISCVAVGTGKALINFVKRPGTLSEFTTQKMSIKHY